MAKKLKRKKKAERKSEADAERDEENIQPPISPEARHTISVVAVFLLALILSLALFDLAGALGKFIVIALKQFLGWAYFTAPIFLFGVGLALLKKDHQPLRTAQLVGFFLLMVCLAGLLHLFVPLPQAIDAIGQNRGGGYIGLALSYPLQKIMGFWASLATIAALLLMSLVLLFNVSLSRVRRIFRGATPTPVEPATAETAQEFTVKKIPEKATAPKKPLVPADLAALEAAHHEGKLFPEKKKILPRVDLPLELLAQPTGKPQSGDVEANKEKIQRTFATFGIQVEMDEVNVGPTVTQYTIRPAEGTKVANIVALQNDLALALAAHPIRIEAPIPGKSLIGIEIPNRAVAAVYLKEIFQSPAFRKRRSNLAVPLGKDVAGNCRVAVLDSMPHLLIAGATGSGKSIYINGLILALLYQNHPENMRLILVDPKRVEFSQYNDIPHLLTPVITDVKRTINALRWTVREMDRRYEVLSQAGERNLAAYNSAHEDEKLPYIVLIIDELADLMAVAAREVEAYIIRLAQMARAVGIHIVVATQRPSVNVVTGLIKANITSRVAFAVASQIDSRTILDTAGAEKLLGRGDMLYVSSEFGKPLRMQGVYVSDDEIRNVVSYLKQHGGEPQYDVSVTEKQPTTLVVNGASYAGNDEDDPLLEEAKQTILRAGKASASLLQRRLSVGYARAARILDLLEGEGFIGPSDGAKPREILVAHEEEVGDNEIIEEEEEDEEETEEEVEDTVDVASSVQDEVALEKNDKEA